MKPGLTGPVALAILAISSVRNIQSFITLTAGIYWCCCQYYSIPCSSRHE